jgi:uncharacterized membrane protein
MKIEHLDTQFKKIQPAVIAFYNNLDHLEKTLNDLKIANFKNEDISILTVKKKDLEKNILEGVASGAITGATGGGILCWLVSLGVLAIPGAGTFIAAGPFISAVAGAAIGGNIGTIAGALIGFGMAEVEAKELEKYIKDKGLIIAVHVNDPLEQAMAKRILVDNEALKIFDPLEKKGPNQWGPARLTNVLDKIELNHRSS